MLDDDELGQAQRRVDDAQIELAMARRARDRVIREALQHHSHAFVATACGISRERVTQIAAGRE